MIKSTIRIFTNYNKSRGFPGVPVTSFIVAAKRLQCSKTQLDVAKPKCTQNSSKHFILELGILGKQISIKRLKIYFFLI